MNIADALEDHARDQPNHPAIEDGERIVTFADLQRRVTAAAHRLHDCGVSSGDIVGVRLPDGPDYLVLCFAIARVGAVILSINDQLAPADQQRAISNLDVKRVVSAEDNDPPLPGCETVPLRRICELEPPDLGAFAGPDLDANHPVVCRQSSGTTGVPKTALWGHAQFLLMEERASGAMAWTSEDRMLQVVRLCFSYSRDVCLSLLQRGGTVVMKRSGTLDDLIRTIRERRITYLSVTPIHVQGILSRATNEGFLLPDLRVLAFTSAALGGDDLRDVMRRVTPNVCQSLGTNEGCTLTVANPEDLAAQPDTVGRVADGLDVCVLDPDGQPLPRGAIGRIGFRGAGLPTEFYRDPQASARHFRQGWYFPGDLAMIDETGYVFYKGRADDVINNQGAKFYPLEVEQVLLSHPDIDEAAVFAWPTTKGGEVAVGCLVGQPRLGLGEIKDFCRSRLTSYKVPAVFAYVSALPKTASGKVVKREVKEMMRALMERDRP